MAWSPPSTQTTGDLITAALWNTNTVTNSIALYNAITDYVLITDEKAQNTDGGTFTSGAWRTRDLNSEKSDTNNLASVASNQVTLAAGTWLFRCFAPAYTVGLHALRLQNITAGTTLITGISNYNNALAISMAYLIGRATLAIQSVLELQHQCGVTVSTNGFGVAANFQAETYAVFEAWRIFAI